MSGTGCRWALALLLLVAALAGVRLLQGTAVGASLNARVYAVAHFFARVTGLLALMQTIAAALVQATSCSDCSE